MKCSSFVDAACLVHSAIKARSSTHTSEGPTHRSEQSPAIYIVKRTRMSVICSYMVQQTRFATAAVCTTLSA